MSPFGAGDERGARRFRLGPGGSLSPPAARYHVAPPVFVLGPAALAALTLLAGCATQSAAGVEPGAPGFLLGLWHGFIFPVAWILSLFMPDVAVYAVPNNGGWYDFGYFIGVVFLGVGARKSHVVYRTRMVRR